MKTTEPVVTKSVKKELKRLKKEGKLGKAARREPHPEGYLRGGFLRPGVTKF
jgi:hypothetical protein